MKLNALPIYLLTLQSLIAAPTATDQLKEGLDEMDLSVVQSAVERGANVNQVFGQQPWEVQGTALMMMANSLGPWNGEVRGEGNHKDRHDRAMAISRYLLEKGARADWKDRYGWSILHAAAFERDLEMVRLLFDHGAKTGIRVSDPRGSDFNGATALLAAFGAALPHGPDRPEIVRLILEHGGKKEVDVPDYYGRTPLSMAAEQLDPESVKMLLDAGAKPNFKARGDFGRTPLEALRHGKRICTENQPGDDHYDMHCPEDWLSRYNRVEVLLKQAGAR